MSEMLSDIRTLLQEKADLNVRLDMIPYDGTPEIKENKGGRYLYIRKRVAGKLTSTYVDVYSDELHQLLLRSTKERREINKQIRRIDKRLADMGYSSAEIPPEVLKNLDFARANMKAIIYDQAVLEGIGTTFPQTEDILENGLIHGVSTNDVQKIVNLKHAWEFILDEDVIRADSDYYLLCHIARQVNEGFYSNGGAVRGVPVSIGGTSYIPPLPIESVVREQLDSILSSSKSDIDIAIDLCLFTMKTQVFIDGNKRAAIIYANHYLISHAAGLLIISEDDVRDFKDLLIQYYEGTSEKNIRHFLRKKSWKKM
jgi:prophage maintenance system killer protein